MSKNMLIDSAHTEEIRVAVVDGEKLDKFDFEVPSKAQIKGNIYLAKIVRVEPSLQAAFVDYGAERHGFLSFSEIHCDYFQIPVGDREDLENHIQNAISALLTETGESVEDLDPQKISKLRYQFYRRYRIQEVIRKRQVVLVQATKEERGNKGAALTTYVSLTGKYCIFMPNMSKGSGVSRKVIGPERTKIKKIVTSLPTASGSVVIRTAGAGRSKAEITKDFTYLKKMWDEIRETTIKSIAPCLIHEEAGIIKRALRDWYSQDMEEIFVEGKEGFQIAKTFMKKMARGHAQKVKLYEDNRLSLFGKFKINDQINQIYSTRADLPSGGYLIINATEALIAIDVNSGKSIRERNIFEMALKTNLEAAVEIARQCRLRDLGGLIVVDFIDMLEKRANAQVERCLRDALREDKAKIQVGVISHFGLLEFSRQRLRASITDANTTVCPCCGGAGVVWSDESVAIQILRKVEETLAVGDCSDVSVTLSANAALYIMNKKRSFISNIEERANSKVIFKIDNLLPVSDFKIELGQQTRPPKEEAEQPKTPLKVEEPEEAENKEVPEQIEAATENAAPSEVEAVRPKKSRRPRKKRGEKKPAAQEESLKATETVEVAETVEAIEVANEPKKSSAAIEISETTEADYPDAARIEKIAEESDRFVEESKKFVAATVQLPNEEEIMQYQQNFALNMTKLARSYREQEEMASINSQFSNERESRTEEKKSGGWWQKLLKKPE